MADTSLLFTLVGRDRVSRTLSRVRSSLDSTGKAATSALAGLSAGIAPASALGVTMLGTASSIASAGIAVGAFKAAVVPQLSAVTDAASLYEAAQEATASGAEDAAEKQQAYADALAEMTPATRDTATAFIGLKDDFSAWSDSLSGTTMPIFTQGIRTLRGLLPSLTPFVTSAATAIGNFMDRIQAGVQSAGFSSWLADMSAASGPALESLLNIIGNVAVGIGGLLQAFLPMNSGMNDLTGGLESASAAFATWATSLKGSAGFSEFTAMASEGGAALGNIAMAALNVAVALAPLLGTTVMLSNAFAQVVSALPTPVLTVLAGVITAGVVAMRAWAIAQAIVTLHNAIWTTSQWSLNAAILANPITWIVIGIVALIAAIVLIATKTTWFQTAWQACMSAVKAAWSFTVNLVKQGISLLVNLFLNFTGPGLFIKHFGKIRSIVSSAMSWVMARIRGAFGIIKTIFLNFTGPGLVIKHFGKIRSVIGSAMSWVASKVRAGINAAISAINGLASMPGRVLGWFSGLGGDIANFFSSGFKGGINALIGAWNGLSLSIPGVSVGGVEVWGGATISTPDIPMLAEGGIVQARRGGTLALLGEGGRDEAVVPLSRGATTAAVGAQRVDVYLHLDGDADLVRLFRRAIRVRGGTVQAVLGTGRG